MVDLARHIRVKALLEEVAAVEDRLAANELEMVRHLAHKYQDPGPSDPDDARVLEVILRNVAIRRGYDVDARHRPPRAIQLERRKD